jgi:TRAP-type uncharacterized transport system fused permease subunit
MFEEVAKLYRIDVTIALLLMTAAMLLAPVPKSGEPWLRDAIQLAIALGCFFLWYPTQRPVRQLRYGVVLWLLYVAGEATGVLVWLAKAVQYEDIQIPAYLLAFWVLEFSCRHLSKEVRTLWVTDSPKTSATKH